MRCRAPLFLLGGVVHHLHEVASATLAAAPPRAVAGGLHLTNGTHLEPQLMPATHVAKSSAYV